MDIYSKIFLINLIAVISVAKLDSFIDCEIEKRVGGTLLGAWAFVSIISVPVYAVYLIATI